jgi:hypothetical protein
VITAIVDGSAAPCWDGAALREARHYAHQHGKEQLAVMTKRKERKRKRLQKGGTLEYSEAADRVAASASLLVNPPKKRRSGGALEGALLPQRRCGTCGETRHNARTCQKDAAESSNSECTLAYVFSDTSEDNNNNPA